MVLVSGDGQIVPARSTKPNDLFVVQVNDAKGNPLPKVDVAWSVSGLGNIPHPENVTDSNGQATCDFTSGILPVNASFAPVTVTATSKYGTVTFHITMVAFTNDDGSFAIPPTTILTKPALESTISGQQGSTLPDAAEILVKSGSGNQSNTPLPNVSFRLVNGIDITKPANGHCDGPNGIVYTNANGVAVCNLVVTGSPGQLSLRAYIGEYHETDFFILNVLPGAPCTFSISPTSKSIPAAGGTGSVKVTASASSCSWTATSNVPWITINSGASGSGSGTVAYTVGADANAGRAGTMTIAGQTFTVNQGAAGSGALTITTPANLPGGGVNQSYSATLSAEGGVAPYKWSITSGNLPAGLAINGDTGVISGAATVAGTTSFTATVTDSANATASLVFSLTISTSSSKFLITNGPFPNGVVGVAYKPVVLTSTGGAGGIFGSHPIFAVSGGALPDGLSIVKNSDQSYSVQGTPTTAGVFNFTISATDSGNNNTAANFTITITGATTSEQMGVNPPSLSFTAELGNAVPPAPQSLAITGNSGVLAYTSVANTTSGGSWLVLQNSAGNTPGTITVSVTNFANLAPGSYSGTVVISSAASNSPVSIPVTLVLQAAPAINVTPSQISLSEGQSSGSNVTTQPIQITAGTSGSSGNSIQAHDSSDSVSFTATATTNKGGNWLTVSPTSGTTPATVTASIDSGGLAVGTYNGTITITPASGPVQTVSIRLDVINPQTLSATPSPVAFTYAQGAPAPDAKTVTVSTNSGPALSLSAAVTTSDNGNWLSVDPHSGTTPLDLSVSVNPTGLAPKTYTGTITISASDDSVTALPIPVTLTVTSPRPTITAVTNAASFVVGPVSPGEFITIFGSGLGPETPVSATGSLPRKLSDTQVFFDTFSAPLLYTSDGQVSAIVPYELANSSSTNLTVWYKGKASAIDDLRVVDAAPGIFMLNAAGQAAVVNQDFTINSSKNGAPIGSVVSIYATGEGQTNPPGKDGAINTDPNNLPAPLLKVVVEIGGLPAEVSYAGAAPDAPAGFLQVNAKVPDGVPKGKSVPVVIKVGTASSQANTTIAIHP